MKLLSGIFNKYQNSRIGFLVLVVYLLLVLSLITRVALLIISFPNIDFGILSLPYIFCIGLFYDLVNASYFIIPLVVYLWLIPQFIYKRNWHKYVLMVLFFSVTVILTLNAVSEWFFWDEFSTRFNFIAVDYLIYTTEVIGNIRQSYPIEWILAILLMVCIAITLYFKSYIFKAAEATERFGKRSVKTLVLLLMPLIFYFTVKTNLHALSNNRYANDLAGNGMYELFAAFFNNTLDYTQFYATEDNDAAFRKVRSLLAENGGTFLSDDLTNLSRKIQSDSAERQLNVVMISVESLSAEYLGVYGNTQNITPFLDSLAQQSLFFTNLYATGTRTVRGLEALSLCIPPTPGQSIVRRPDNEQLFSLGNIFTSKGYESRFIYGGYGYFDNMGYFFANNNYTVCDRDMINDKDIHYENIWGVADEDLFDLSIQQIESSVSRGKHFFNHIMTTTNHRPFTYPGGRIDIPSGKSREGAVKYTDYAIGRFIKTCATKPWFNSTIFIIVADHCASSAGKTDLPFNKYQIPLLIYSPENIPAAKMERMMSQIDIGPTLLGLLNFSYTSKFFGYDMFKVKPGQERAFISTYQNLGYIKNDQLVVLSPQQKKEQFIMDFKNKSQSLGPLDQKLAEEAIAWYQVSSYVFEKGLMKK